MQAHVQTVAPAAPRLSGRTRTLTWITALYFAANAIWYLALTFIDSEDFGASQWIGTSLFFSLGLIALGGMWRRYRWGRWMMIVVTAVNLLLTGPEVIILEGTLRVGSIAAISCLAAIMVLLFRPEIRKQS